MAKVLVSADSVNVPAVTSFLPFINIPRLKASCKADKRKDDKKECIAQKFVNSQETISGIFTGYSVGSAARKSRMSLYGALSNTSVACVGGGTLYSLIRNEYPSWVRSPSFLAKCLLACGVGYYGFWKKGFTRPWVRRVAEKADLVTLGAAAIAGGREIVEGKGSYVTAALSASLGAVGGGLCWDLIMRRPPSAFKPGAKSLVIPPVVGAWCYPLFYSQRYPNATIVCTVATTIGLHYIISKEKK